MLTFQDQNLCVRSDLVNELSAVLIGLKCGICKGNLLRCFFFYPDRNLVNGPTSIRLREGKACFHQMVTAVPKT